MFISKLKNVASYCNYYYLELWDFLRLHVRSLRQKDKIEETQVLKVGGSKMVCKS